MRMWPALARNRCEVPPEVCELRMLRSAAVLPKRCRREMNGFIGGVILGSAFPPAFLPDCDHADTAGDD